MFDPGLMDMIMRLRSRGIFDTDVLRAIETAPRKHFVGDDFWEKAYADRALPIACGQSISEPLAVAMMTQALEAKPDHKLLEIGTGSGYHTAVLSRITKRVYTVERYHQLLSLAEMRFQKLGFTNIVTRHGDGRYGWNGQAPFDRVIVTCGVNSPPKALLKQVASGGILIAVVKGQLMRFTRGPYKFKEETILPLELPLSEIGKSHVL